MMRVLRALREEASAAIKTFLIALATLFVFQELLYEPFWIPSGSMYPTLEVGDYLLVSKFSYGYSRFSFSFRGLFSEPFSGDGRFPASGSDSDVDSGTGAGRIERGDVVVFEMPDLLRANASVGIGVGPEAEGWWARVSKSWQGEKGVIYIKRVVGLPGETIQVRQGILHIDGVAVGRVDPGGGDATYIHGLPFVVRQYDEIFPEGRVHPIWESHDSDSTRPFVVPAGHYFMMGDNRDNSQDSRSRIGTVPLERIIGRADLIFFSRSGERPVWQFWHWPTTVRKHRLFSVPR